MTLDSIFELVRSLWVVWLMAIFIAIVAWAFWPRNKAKLEAHGRIPLDDDYENKDR